MGQVQKTSRVCGLRKEHLTQRAEKKKSETERNGREMPQEKVEELRLRYEQAQQANRAKRDFINTLSHELRMPIHVIIGCGDLLLDGAWGMLQENQKAIVLKMKQNAGYLFDLISDLMELNRLDGEGGTVRCEEINVDGLLEEVEAMTEFMPKAEGVVLKVTRPPGLPPTFSDRDKLKIILRNLVGNAIKFTKEGQITIGARFDPQEQMMELSVRDTGIGIDEKDRQRIFDMFWQAEDSHARRFGGVGLGLHIVKRLTDQIDANIKVKSEKGKGSLFCLRIPIVPK